MYLQDAPGRARPLHFDHQSGGNRPSTVSVGLITPGSNAFAPQALGAIASYGFASVAL